MSLEAEMANTPGWRDRWLLKGLLVVSLVVILLSVVMSAIGSFL